jgi:hypothetical protein
MNPNIVINYQGSLSLMLCMLGGILHVGSERGLREILIKVLIEHQEATGIDMQAIIAIVRSQLLTQDYVPKKRDMTLLSDPYRGFPAGTDFTAQEDLLKELLIG